MIDLTECQEKVVILKGYPLNINCISGENLFHKTTNGDVIFPTSLSLYLQSTLSWYLIFFCSKYSWHFHAHLCPTMKEVTASCSLLTFGVLCFPTFYYPTWWQKSFYTGNTWSTILLRIVANIYGFSQHLVFPNILFVCMCQVATCQWTEMQLYWQTEICNLW